MFNHFFFLLRAYGVPVTITEWLALMEALSKGLAFSSLTDFYALARGVLVKSEAFYDQYDQAFAHAFRGIETPKKLEDAVWEWLANPLPPLMLSADEQARLAAAMELLDLQELNRLFEERLREQKEAHHGGQHWVGTGGTSPFGHSGFHPGGIRVGGESRGQSAVKVAAERRYKEYRTDATLNVRQLETAFRRLRVLSSRTDLPPDELDLEGTVEQTSRKGGLLTLEWKRSRRNQVRVLVLMDAGGSMHQHISLCNRLFTAVNRASHFKDLRFYYFHNCVYDRLYLDHMCHPRNSVFTAEVLHQLSAEYKLILVGDAAMAPTELLARDGIIWWGYGNEEPGIEWLGRLQKHFTHSAWLNPIPEYQWQTAYGAETIALVAKVFPMFELSVDGLTAAVKRLSVRR